LGGGVQGAQLLGRDTAVLFLWLRGRLAGCGRRRLLGLGRAGIGIGPFGCTHGGLRGCRFDGEAAIFRRREPPAATPRRAFRLPPQRWPGVVRAVREASRRRAPRRWPAGTLMRSPSLAWAYAGAPEEYGPASPPHFS